MVYGSSLGATVNCNPSFFLIIIIALGCFPRGIIPVYGGLYGDIWKGKTKTGGERRGDGLGPAQVWVHCIGIVERDGTLLGN